MSIFTISLSASIIVNEPLGVTNQCISAGLKHGLHQEGKIKHANPKKEFPARSVVFWVNTGAADKQGIVGNLATVGRKQEEGNM